MQVLCAENHVSKTFDINQRTEDEFLKNTSSLLWIKHCSLLLACLISMTTH